MYFSKQSCCYDTTDTKYLNREFWKIKCYKAFSVYKRLPSAPLKNYERLNIIIIDHKSSNDNRM